MKRSTIAKTFTIAAVTALGLAIAPTAKADNKGCSIATLIGTFAHAASGVVTAPAAMAGPVASIGTETFDGNGGITGGGMLNENGTVIPFTETGTYTVNSDCSGTYTAQLSIGIVAHVFFLIDDSVNELRFIGTDAGSVLSGTARRQFPVADWRNQ